jgi:hypothetical protein
MASIAGERIRRAEKLSPGPIGRGTRFRAEAVTLGRTVGMTIEYTAYERPKRLGSSIHMAAADILGTLRFDPVPDGTRMSWPWKMRLRGLYSGSWKGGKRWSATRRPSATFGRLRR